MVRYVRWYRENQTIMEDVIYFCLTTYQSIQVLVDLIFKTCYNIDQAEINIVFQLQIKLFMLNCTAVEPTAYNYTCNACGQDRALPPPLKKNYTENECE